MVVVKGKGVVYSYFYDFISNLVDLAYIISTFVSREKVSIFLYLFHLGCYTIFSYFIQIFMM